MSFAAGDVASMVGKVRKKAGVFAVRAGPYLATNLRAFIEQRALKDFHPQSSYLALIGLGGRPGAGHSWKFCVKGGFLVASKTLDRYTLYAKIHPITRNADAPASNAGSGR